MDYFDSYSETDHFPHLTKHVSLTPFIHLFRESVSILNAFSIFHYMRNPLYYWLVLVCPWCLTFIKHWHSRSY